MRSVLLSLLLLAFPLSSVAQPPPANLTELSKDLQIYPIADNIWVHRSWARIEGVRYPANGLLIEDNHALMLIDTAWGNESTEKLLTWIEQHFGKQPDLAVLTHAHADRIGGLPALAAHGVTAFVHPQTLALARDRYPPEQLPKAIQQLNDHTVSQLDALEVFYPGPAHSPDNIVVWYEPAKLLFGGCAVKSAVAEDIHYVEGSSPEDWPQAVRRIQARYHLADTVVPGHGATGNPRLLDHTLELALHGLTTLKNKDQSGAGL